jgi:hypothetical protein
VRIHRIVFAVACALLNRSAGSMPSRAPSSIRSARPSGRRAGEHVLVEGLHRVIEAISHPALGSPGQRLRPRIPLPDFMQSPERSSGRFDDTGSATSPEDVHEGRAAFHSSSSDDPANQLQGNRNCVGVVITHRRIMIGATTTAYYKTAYCKTAYCKLPRLYRRLALSALRRSLSVPPA